MKKDLEQVFKKILLIEAEAKVKQGIKFNNQFLLKRKANLNFIYYKVIFLIFEEYFKP